MRIWSEIDRNWRVCKNEAWEYWTEIQYVIVPGIKSATWSRKLHKFHALIEEFFDKCPRICSYLFWPIILITIITGE